jgi:hypothetical protein
MTHTTRYETRNGKTRRVKGQAPAAGKAENVEAAGTAGAPKTNSADNNHTPGKLAKEGV